MRIVGLVDAAGRPTATFLGAQVQPQIPPQAQGQVNEASSEYNTALRYADAIGTMADIAQGKRDLSTAQVTSCIATIATASVLLAGETGGTAALAGGVVIVLISTTLLVGEGVMWLSNLLGTSAGPGPGCEATAAKDPDDPYWVTFETAIRGGQGMPGGPGGNNGWQPATQGPFETWARIILKRDYELVPNCRDPVIYGSQLAFNQLVDFWNSAHKGPSKHIAKYAAPRWTCADGSTVPAGQQCARGFSDPRDAMSYDPVQLYLPDQGIDVNEGDFVPPPPHVIPGNLYCAFHPGDPSCAAAASKSSTAAKVAGGVAVAAVAAPAVWAIVKRQAVGATYERVWKKLRDLVKI